MRRDIAAFTASDDNLPAFISVQDLGSDVLVTIRGKRVRNDVKGRDDPGPTAEIRMPGLAWDMIVADAKAYKRGG